MMSSSSYLQVIFLEVTPYGFILKKIVKSKEMNDCVQRCKILKDVFGEENSYHEDVNEQASKLFNNVNNVEEAT